MSKRAPACTKCRKQSTGEVRLQNSEFRFPVCSECDWVLNSLILKWLGVGNWKDLAAQVKAKVKP